jgi:hypothetical protein
MAQGFVLKWTSTAIKSANRLDARHTWQHVTCWGLMLGSFIVPADAQVFIRTLELVVYLYGPEVFRKKESKKGTMSKVRGLEHLCSLKESIRL